jgi:hypothetical protein
MRLRPSASTKIPDQETRRSSIAPTPPPHFCRREDLSNRRALWRFDNPGFHSQAFISTLRPRNRTPSDWSRSRCSAADSPRNLISPPAPRTRCQGKPNPRCNTRATIRASPGNPAAFATPPYVNTFPRGIARITRSMRRISVPCPEELSFLFISERFRRYSGVPHPSFAVLEKEGGEFDFFSNHRSRWPAQTRSAELEV